MDNCWYSSKEIRNILKISSQYLYKLKKDGKLEFKKISDKKFIYKLPKNFEKDKNIAIYARVSTPKQKADLENQIEVLKMFALGKGKILNNDYIFKDIASGMNENRKELNKLIDTIKDGKISELYISHKDRLTRFGYGYLEHIFNSYGCKIIPINYTEEKTFQEELSEDLIAIIHHFSMKFYGKRKNLIKKIEKDINSINNIN